MVDLYIVDFGGDDEERARREAERDAELRRLRVRYERHIVSDADVDGPTARRVIAALFDPRDRAIVCQARSRPWKPSAIERNSGSVKVVKPAYTLLIFW